MINHNFGLNIIHYIPLCRCEKISHLIVPHPQLNILLLPNINQDCNDRPEKTKTYFALKLYLVTLKLSSFRFSKSHNI